MSKLWEGITDGKINELADKFNSSIKVDKRLYEEDIKGSIAHAFMLGECGIIEKSSAENIISGLEGVLKDIKSGALAIDESAEDIHTFIEETLTARIGEDGKKLHTARSRNDQVALDTRAFTLKAIDETIKKLKALIAAIAEKAEECKATVMSGYTHLRRAQPITFGYHLLAYAEMFLRDADRLVDCRKRVDNSPIGCCALAGTTFLTDRVAEAKALGFNGVCQNGIDGVSDRDFVAETLFCASLIMTHLSRFSEELILWSSAEFDYIEIPSGFTTGSSIMPQKQNPDIAELTRGKVGRVYGDLIAILTTLKALPLAYNKDMQEDKESLFDGLDTVNACLEVFAPMIAGIKAKEAVMLAAAEKGFINATDVADYLVKRGRPFRSAYKTVGKIVAYCTETDKTFSTLTIEEFKGFDELFDADVYEEISLYNCVNKRNSFGGTSVGSVEKQIENIKEALL